jgi:hypothetical protein
MALEHRMVEPFEPGQVRVGGLGYARVRDVLEPQVGVLGRPASALNERTAGGK